MQIIIRLPEGNDEKAMSKEIEITEENYGIYDEFYRLVQNSAFFFTKRETIQWTVSIIISFTIPIFIGCNLIIAFPNMHTLLIMLIDIFIAMIAGTNLFIANEIIRKVNMKKFQKEYPNFDITLDVREVEKALEKYNELSEIPKDIEEKKCEHLTNLPDEVKKVSTQEKLAYLEQEKEFWEQVAVQEKYQNLEEQKEIPMQKSLS